MRAVEKVNLRVDIHPCSVHTYIVAAVYEPYLWSQTKKAKGDERRCFLFSRLISAPGIRFGKSKQVLPASQRELNRKTEAGTENASGRQTQTLRSGPRQQNEASPGRLEVSRVCTCLF